MKLLAIAALAADRHLHAGSRRAPEFILGNGIQHRQCDVSEGAGPRPFQPSPRPFVQSLLSIIFEVQGNYVGSDPDPRSPHNAAVSDQGRTLNAHYKWKPRGGLAWGPPTVSDWMVSIAGLTTCAVTHCVV